LRLKYLLNAFIISKLFFLIAFDFNSIILAFISLTLFLCSFQKWFALCCVSVPKIIKIIDLLLKTDRWSQLIPLNPFDLGNASLKVSYSWEYKNFRLVLSLILPLIYQKLIFVLLEEANIQNKLLINNILT
jgi:hypothetical protein